MSYCSHVHVFPGLTDLLRLLDIRAVASVGSTSGMNGTAQTYPSYNTISGNHFDTIGIYTKQVSLFMLLFTLHVFRSSHCVLFHTVDQLLLPCTVIQEHCVKQHLP